MRTFVLSACVFALAQAMISAQAQPATAESSWVSDPKTYCWAKTSAEAAAPQAPADDAGARAYVWDNRHALTPLCLFESSVAWADSDLDKAAELYALAKIRARYDVLRCKTPNAEAPTTAKFKSLDTRVAKMLNDLRAGEAGWLSGTVKRVVLTNEAFAYDGRRLQDMCAVSGPGSRSTWNKARYSIETTIAAAP